MKRYKSKVERKYGENLQIKGERGLSPKAGFRRRPSPPGPKRNTRFRRKLSEYGRQLAEKQKLRISYGLKERQFRNIVKKAAASQEQADIALMKLLERRLDNVVMRMGIAESRAQARQIVNHAHIKVNGKTNNIPSYVVKKGDVITVKKRFQESAFLKNIQVKLKNFNPPSWITLDKAKLEAKINAYPEGRDIETNIDLAQVIEYYSR